MGKTPNDITFMLTCMLYIFSDTYFFPPKIELNSPIAPVATDPATPTFTISVEPLITVFVVPCGS